MTTYADNLRTIVGIKEVQAELQAQLDKLQLLSNRGIGYNDATGAVAGANGITPNNINDNGLSPIVKTGEDAIVSGATDAAQSALSGTVSATSDGGTAGGTAGATALGATTGNDGATVGASDGGYDALAILAGAVNVGAAQTVKSITGLTDPGSNRSIQINEDGRDRPPADRATPDVDGQEGGYFNGYRWGWNGIGGNTYPDAEAAGRAFIAAEPDPTLFQYTGVSDYSFSAGHHFALGNANIVAGGTFQFNLQGDPCTPGVDTGCAIIAPTVYAWPYQPTSQIRMGQKGYTGNPRDLNLPLGYVAGSGIVVAKSSDGNYFTQKPMSNGGFMVGASDNVGTFNGAIVRIFNSAGKAISVTTPTVANAMALP